MIGLMKRSPLARYNLAAMASFGMTWLFVIVVFATAAFSAPQERTSPAFRAYAVPVSQVISFQEGIGLLDTTTGSLFELRGNLDNPSATLSWFPRVEGVEGGSGYLQVQSPRFNSPDAVFLVDVVTGDTWILRDRGNKNGSWEPVSR